MKSGKLANVLHECCGWPQLFTAALWAERWGVGLAFQMGMVPMDGKPTMPCLGEEIPRGLDRFQEMISAGLQKIDEALWSKTGSFIMHLVQQNRFRQRAFGVEYW